MDSEYMPKWLFTQLSDLAKAQPFGDGRVRLGFAFDGLFLPKETVVDLFDKVRDMGVKLITTHYVNSKNPIVSMSTLLLRPKSCWLGKVASLF